MRPSQLIQRGGFHYLPKAGPGQAFLSEGTEEGRKGASERGRRGGGGEYFSQQCGGVSCKDLLLSDGSLRLTPSFSKRRGLGEEISTSNFLIIRSFSRSAVQTRPAGRGLGSVPRLLLLSQTCFHPLAPRRARAGRAAEPVAIP